MPPSSSKEEPAKPGATLHLRVHGGLEGFDDDLDTLIGLFEELQLFSGDIANPELDLLTFASVAHYFGVLTEYTVLPPPEEDLKEKDTKEKDNGLRPVTFSSAPRSEPSYYYQSPFRHSKPRQDPVNWRDNEVKSDAMTESFLDDLEEALRVLDTYTDEEKSKAFQRGGVFVGSAGSKRFVPLGGGIGASPAPKDKVKREEVDDVLDIRPLRNSGAPAQTTWSVDHLWTGVDEDIRKSAMEVEEHAKEQEVYEGVGEANPGGDLVSASGSGSFQDRVNAAENAMRSFADELEADIYSDRDPVAGASDSVPAYDDLFAVSSAQEMIETARNTDFNARWDAPLESVQTMGTGQGIQQYREHIFNPLLNYNPVNQRAKANKQRVIGFIYLANAQGAADYLRSGELNMGIFISEKYRRQGYALQAAQIVLEKAFEDRNCNRVQAVVVDGPFKHAAMNVFMKSGFGHEGTRRRAFRSPYTMEFKDVTYLGILATDWVLRHIPVGGAESSASSTTGPPPVQRLRIAPTTLWDEMLERHQREREELLRWEEGGEYGLRGLKRSVSNETIKEAYYAKTDADDTTDSESVYASGRSKASSVSGAGYHTSSSGGGSSPAKKAKIEKGKGKSTALGTSRLSTSSWSQAGKPLASNRRLSFSDYEDSDMDDTTNNINIGSWIANTNASINNDPTTPAGGSASSFQAIRSRSVETSSESGFSEVSRASTADDSASDAGSEVSFSSLPSEASSSSGWGSNWDMVDGIEYVSDLESQSGLR